MHVNLANNHIMDFGIAGLQETRTELRENNIRFFGAGMNETEANTPCIIKDKNGKRIAIFGFCSETTGATAAKHDDKPGVARLSISNVKQVLMPYKSYDKRIAYFHFGVEYEDFPEPYMKQMIEELLEEDYLDIILGNHPHCIQGIISKKEDEKSRLCFCSMGNFIMPEEKYCNGTLCYPIKSHLGFGLIYNSDTSEIEIVPYELDKSGNRATTIEKSSFLEKLNQLSECLLLNEKDYLSFYKKNRKSKKWLLYTKNESVNNIILSLYRIYYNVIYINKKIIKTILKQFGISIKSDINTGKRTIYKNR